MENLNNESVQNKANLDGENQIHSNPDFRRFIRLIQTNKMWMFSAVLFSISISLAVHMMEKRIYVSTGIVAMGTKNVLIPGANSPFVDNITPKMFALIEEFKKPKNCTAIIDEVGKLEPWALELYSSTDICKSITVTPDFEKIYFNVSASTSDPQLSKILATIGAEQLIKIDQQRMSGKVDEVRKFLTEQERTLGRQLTQLESKKTQFQSNTSVISVSQAERSIFDSLEKSEQEYLDAEIRLNTNETLLQETKKTIAEVKELLTRNEGAESSFYLGQMQYRLNMLKYRKSMIKDTTELAKIDNEMNEILTVYKKVLNGSPSQVMIMHGDLLEYYKTLQDSKNGLEKDKQQLSHQMAFLQKNLKRRNNDIRTLASNIQTLGEINREIDVTNDLYLVIKKRLQEVEIEKASLVTDLSLLREASIGTPKNISLFARTLFYMAVAVFMTVFITLFREAFIPAIKNISEFASMGIYPMGYIPVVPVNPLSHMPLLLRDYPNSIEADTFRALRLRLENVRQLRTTENKSVSLLVTSPRSGSGKSFISTNLAYALSSSGHKTLLIDLDLRHPSVLAYFEADMLDNSFDNYLNTKNLNDSVSKVTNTLDIMATTHDYENPVSKIEQLSIAELIDKAKQDYEFIIIDMPPVLSVIDPMLIVPHVDYSMLTIEHRKTHREDVSETIRHLTELSSQPILGVVNMADPKLVSADGGKYYRVMTSHRRKTA